MKVTRADKTRGLYEYAFWRAIDRFNDTVTGEHVITTSEARGLHQKWVERLESMKRTGADGQSVYLTRETAGPKPVMAAMNAVLAERTKQDVYPETSGQTKYGSVQFDQAWREYLDYLGGPVDEIDSNHVMPISPYDERFSGRDAFLRNGSSLCAVRGGMADSLEEAVHPLASRMVRLTSRPWVRDDGKVAGRKAGMVTTEADLTGLSILKPYMTENEYRDLSQWVAKGFDIEHIDMAQFRANQAVAERGAAVLRSLREMGYSYSVKRDRELGQIKATLDNTRVEVRVMDPVSDGQYVGKVYDNGAEVTMSSTFFQNGQRAVPIQNEKSTVDMVRFALGEPVVRQDTGELLGKTSTVEMLRGNKTVVYNGAYHSSTGDFSAVYDNSPDLSGKMDTRFGNKTYMRMSVQNRRDVTTSMPNEEAADAYLRDAVSSARVNYYAELNPEGVIEQVKEAGVELDIEELTYSDNPDIAIVQRGYVELLTGQRRTLAVPGKGEELADDFYEAVSDQERTYDEGMPVEEMILAHGRDSVDAVIGNYERDESGRRRIDPVMISQYQTSAYSVYRNSDDLVKAMRMLGFSADEVMGDTFAANLYRDKLVMFDFATAVPMKERESAFMRSMYEEITQSLAANGVEFDENNVLIDDHGIVRYSGKVYRTQGRKEAVDIHGEIGQLFEPDGRGVVRTGFNGTDNYAFVPGYEATILPQKSGENLSMEERTRLIGYEQAMRRSIRHRMRQSLLAAGKGESVGAPTLLNDTYRHLYTERHELDFEDQFLMQGMDESLLDSIIRTEASRVRYGNDIRDGSTVYAAYSAERDGIDLANDNNGDAYTLTGRRDVSILTSASDGYFDPVATTATSTNQGAVRYLVEGASVDSEGKMVRSADLSDRTPIMKHEYMQYVGFNPFDRQCMTLSNLMQASSVTEPSRVALMPFGGWNMDDGIVVSKRFAQNNGVRGHDGYRELVVGDKLSDFHGNKGVISLIVDPDMSVEEAREQGLEDAVNLFRNNPELDVVMAPFSGVSRFNGGTGREMMGLAEPLPLMDHEGEQLDRAGIGAMRLIVTDKAADTKTHTYDDDEVAAGRGRKASAQLAWAFNSKGADAILRECYGPNNGALANVREMLITVGLDLDEEGRPRIGYAPHEGEARNIFHMPELQYRTLRDGVSQTLDNVAMNKTLVDQLSRSGGFMELPFELKFPTGAPLPPLMADGDRVASSEADWAEAGYGDADDRRKGKGTTRRDLTWGLPVMSSYLRSGQSFEDGTSTVHDYTNHYRSIYQLANQYRHAQGVLAGFEGQDVRDLSEVERKAYDKARETIATTPKRAQGHFDSITGDVRNRQMQGKHNMWRDMVMSRRMPNSATAIWTEDPRLSIDEVGMSPAMAAKIGVKEDQKVLIWRDPILRDSGVRYMKVKLDDRLTGISINPVMSKCFDGDFDGDTIGVLKLHTPEARVQADELFSVKANLIDYGTAKDGVSDLSMHESLDIKVAESMNKDLKGVMPAIRDDVALWEQRYKDGDIGISELDARREEAIDQLNAFYQQAFKESFASDAIDFEDVGGHLQSLYDVCVETGAKGSLDKMQTYMQYMGVSCDTSNLDVEGFENAVDHGQSRATRAMMEETMHATAVKSHGTGLGGGYSQRGMLALRDVCPTAVCEMTYPVTQGLLQVKHSAEDARSLYRSLHGSVRSLWRGYKLEFDEANNQWSEVRDPETGAFIQDDPEHWQQVVKQLYGSPTKVNGLNVKFNDAHIATLAKALTDGQGRIMGVEEYATMHASGLDRLAYGGTFDTFVELAASDESIFNGRNTEQFMPSSVRHNRQVARAMSGEAPGVEITTPSADIAHDVAQALGSDKRGYRSIVKKDVVREESKQASPVVREPLHVEVSEQDVEEAYSL